MERNVDGGLTLARAIGQLYISGAEPSFERIPQFRGKLVGVPTYAWDHQISRWLKDSVIAHTIKQRVSIETGKQVKGVGLASGSLSADGSE